MTSSGTSPYLSYYDGAMSFTHCAAPPPPPKKRKADKTPTEGQTPGSSHDCEVRTRSVSQSPDSVTAPSYDGCSSAADAVIVMTSNANHESTTISRSGIRSPPLWTTASPSSSRASASSLLKAPTSNNIFNPYKKQAPNIPAVLDPKMTKKRKFAEKYHGEAVHHSHRSWRNSRSIAGRRHTVSPLSASEVRRMTQQWRRSWRENPCDSASSELLCKNLDGRPLRPRLFLFHRHGEHASQHRRPIQPRKFGGSNGEAERTPTSQQRQQEGVWELGTGITELAGEGGSGKTQICLSLCVTCALTPLLFPAERGGNDSPAVLIVANAREIHNDHYTSIYVTMGEGIPSGVIAARLEKMVRARREIIEPNETMEILSRIGLLSIRNEEEFVEFVERDLPNLLASQDPDARRHRGQRRQQAAKIGLVAFDGIAGFFRFSDPLFQRSQNPVFHRERGSKLLQISSQLRRLSDIYDVHMLITNQVTACIPPIARSDGSNVSSSSSASEQVEPALGLLWSNCVSTRIMLLRKDGMMATVPDQDSSHSNQDKLKNVGENDGKRGTKVLRVRMARILQSVNMPKERKVWFHIDSGEVAAII